MDPFFLVLEGWWWMVPAAAGAGAAAYGGLTATSRRARRIELDAARHEERAAYLALTRARADVGTAQAGVHDARATTRASMLDVLVPTTTETLAARTRLWDAKRSERAAASALKATRTRVKSAYIEYRARGAHDPLPLEVLFRAHDAANAHWLAYETDPFLALDYPDMGSPRHPATLAFLRAQREAHALRPTSARDRITPQAYLDYRAAVQALETALVEAERQSGVTGRRPAAGQR